MHCLIEPLRLVLCVSEPLLVVNLFSLFSPLSLDLGIVNPKYLSLDISFPVFVNLSRYHVPRPALHEP